MRPRLAQRLMRAPSLGQSERPSLPKPSRLLLIVVRSTVGCPAICWSGLITTPLVYFRRLFIAVFEFDVRPRNIASSSQPARLVSAQFAVRRPRQNTVPRA